jgi:hypothetical protein
MSFLYPTFLYALAAVAIPILIHLFNFRRYKTVLFSDVRFLKDIKKETKAKSQLKDLLILLCRILAIVFLVLAFAQPYIPGKSDMGKVKEELLGIYLDNSFSSEAESRNGRILDVAKNRVLEIIDTYKPETRFVLLTNNMKRIHQQFVSGDELRRFTMELKATPKVVDLPDAVDRLHNFLNEYEGSGLVKKSIIVLSDFQKSSANLEYLSSDSLNNIMFLPLSTQFTNNLYIDSCWFAGPGRKLNHAEDLYISVVNGSGEVLTDVPVTLYLNNTLKSVATVDIEPESSAVVKMSFMNGQKGYINGRIEVSDYPITFDNTFYFSYEIADQINILSVNDEASEKYISSLLSPEEYFRLTSNDENNIQYSSFKDNQLVIVNELSTITSGFTQEIGKFIQQGGVLLFIPNGEGDLESYNRLFSSLGINEFTSVVDSETRLADIDFTNVLFENSFRKIEEDIELPLISLHYKTGLNSRSGGEDILFTVSGDPVLSRYVLGKGKVFVFTVPVNESYGQLVRHPIFLPIVYNMAFSAQSVAELYHEIRNGLQIELPSSFDKIKSSVQIGMFGDDYLLVPEIINSRQAIKFVPGDDITEAANYRFINDEKWVGNISFNYARQESDLRCYSHKELKDHMKNSGLSGYSVLDIKNSELADEIENVDLGTNLWKIFLLTVLLFVLCEILLVRFWDKIVRY